MWVLRVFLIMVIIMLVLGFAVYNSTQQININIFGREYFGVPLMVVVFWALVLGMLISFLLGVSYYFRIQSELRTQRKENKRLIEEITALRNLPLEESGEEKEIFSPGMPSESEGKENF